METKTLRDKEQIKKIFLEQGYVGPFPALSSKALKNLQIAVRKDYQNWSWLFRLPLEKINLLKVDPMYSRNAHINSSLTYKASTDPEILDRVSAILGPDILIWISEVICRWPGHNGADWHIDVINATVEGVHVSVALSEMNRKNGCLQIIPGTHHYSVDLNELAHRGECDLSDAQSMAKLADRIAPENSPHQVLSIELKAGEYFFTKGGLWHGVVANRTLKSRMAFLTRFMHPQFANRTDSPCVLVRGQDTYHLKSLHSPPES